MVGFVRPSFVDRQCNPLTGAGHDAKLPGPGQEPFPGGLPAMLRPRLGISAVALLATCALARSAFALEECRLLRQPDIHGDRIVFVYAADLWTVARTGGMATPLTTHHHLQPPP